MTLLAARIEGEWADSPSTFGAGGAEPYASALQNNDDVLYLRRAFSIGQAATSIDAGRWSADADATDQRLLDGITGPVLDIGCGPGRMVRAAMGRGLPALGVDVSATAVRMAADAGLSVLQGSVFDPLPGEGAWAAALLVDGNIGIGGDASALLGRCAELLAPNGVLLVELSHDETRDDSYLGTIEDSTGGRSSVFPWAEIGIHGIRARAGAAGLTVAQDWRLDGRWFARLLRA
ncbi:MAG: class I SAM-dependent methyltransferase [Ramlibacter sp.]|nr:class I SAM-dependent methyltransferase [Cryobacterium sp.]